MTLPERFRRRINILKTKIPSFVIPRSKFRECHLLKKLAGNFILIEDCLFNGDIGIFLNGDEIRTVSPLVENLIEEEMDGDSVNGMKNRGIFYFREHFKYWGEDGRQKMGDGFIVTSRKIIFTSRDEAEKTIPIGKCPRFIQPYLATLVENAQFDILDECVKIEDMDPDFRKWLVIQSGWRGPAFSYKLICSVPLSPSEYAYLYFRIHNVLKTSGMMNPLAVIHDKLKGSRRLLWFLCSLKRNSIGYFCSENLWDSVFGELEYGELTDCLMNDVFKDEKRIIQKYMEKCLI